MRLSTKATRSRCLAAVGSDGGGIICSRLPSGWRRLRSRASWPSLWCWFGSSDVGCEGRTSRVPTQRSAGAKSIFGATMRSTVRMRVRPCTSQGGRRVRCRSRTSTSRSRSLGCGDRAGDCLEDHRNESRAPASSCPIERSAGQPARPCCGVIVVVARAPSAAALLRGALGRTRRAQADTCTDRS